MRILEEFKIEWEEWNKDKLEELKMEKISIINLKGGVAKTISSVNIAYILAEKYNKKVLLIDNDKQGNVTKMFDLHDENRPSISEVLTLKKLAKEVIRKSKYENLDIIPANMTLLKANMDVMMDVGREQHNRLSKTLKEVEDEYDYCIIDNPPDINISVINAMVASNSILIPIKIDKFAFDGMKELMEQINNARALNKDLNIVRCFITCFGNNEVNLQGEEYLNKASYPMMKTHIRRTLKVDESTFANMPVLEYSRRCGASKDYMSLVKEYLELTGGNNNGINE